MIYILLVGVILPLVIVALLVGRRVYQLPKNANLSHVEHDALVEYLNNWSELRVYLEKLFRHSFKVAGQYILHFGVRTLYHVRELFDFIYAKARNKFLTTAIKDKKAVSRFWEHLKEYRQEMNEEDK